MKTKLIALALSAFSYIPAFAQLYYPTTGTGSGALPPSGYGNTFFGNYSGNATSSGDENTFFGHWAGYSNNIGSYNTFTGFAAGIYNTTGSSNTFTGNYAGSANTSGQLNTFTGFRSGYSNYSGDTNVFGGAEAGYYNSSGSGNVYQGYRAGYFSNSHTNTFVGSKAGSYQSTGNYNTFLGSEAGSYFDSTTFNTCVGYRAGTWSYGSYNTFLGTYTGSYYNDVYKSGAIGFNAQVTTDSTIAMGGPASSGDEVTVVIGQTARTSGYVLEINGSAYAGSGSGIWSPSDRQFKRDIQNYTNALDVINKLRPVRYFFKDDVYFTPEKGDAGKPVKRNFEKEEQIGFIAQELELVLPNLVRTDKNGFKAVNYDKLFGVLTQGIKELHDQNKELTAKLDAVNALLLSQKENSTTTAEKDRGATKTKGYIESVTPNPFGVSTTIQYVIPENYRQANLSVVSESGIRAADFPINESGKGMFVFAGETLKPGAFYCYLSVNGVIVDYKKIVLAR
ncbi:MAG: tail fiber domain-containing protein [Bacteroidota bacterium]